MNINMNTSITFNNSITVAELIEQLQHVESLLPGAKVSFEVNENRDGIHVGPRLTTMRFHATHSRTNPTLPHDKGDGVSDAIEQGVMHHVILERFYTLPRETRTLDELEKITYEVYDEMNVKDDDGDFTMAEKAFSTLSHLAIDSRD